MKKRRILSFLLLIALLLSLSTGALATAEQDTEGIIQPEDELTDAGNLEEASPGQLDGEEAGENGSGGGEEPEPPVEPVWEDFTDVDGHWAEPTLEKAFNDGLIKGFEDSTLRPENAITTAQMITVLTRVLGATQKADVSSWGIDPQAWYYEAAELAAFLGLIDGSSGNLDAKMTRQDAFTMMSKAFALTGASPDLSVLDAYSDAGSIKAENKPHMAALVSSGLVQGFGNSLNVNGDIKRAEFFAVLYRVAENYLPAGEIKGDISGGTIVQGGGSLSDLTADDLWFDCAVQSVSLNRVNADSVTLKNHALTSLSISGGSIGTFVIDCGSADVKLAFMSGGSLDTVRLQSGGSLTVDKAPVKNIEITGDNQSITLSGSFESLVISGSNNVVNLSDKTAVGSLAVTGNKNKIVSVAEGDSPASVTVSGDIGIGGAENNVLLNGGFGGGIAESGDTNTLSLVSGGEIGKVSLTGHASWVSLNCGNIESIALGGNYYVVNKSNSGEDESAVARLVVSGSGSVLNLYDKTNYESIEVTGSFNTFQFEARADDVTVNARKTSFHGNGVIKRLTLNATGCVIETPVTNLIDNSRDYDVDRVLALVSSTYAGNYTLAWAEAHDYEDYEKEIWVNAKGYSSSTDYLIWINLAMQRVNIFSGSKGDWTLIRSCIVGTGAPGSRTPLGVYYTTYKLASGWTTSTYSCRPVVGFRENSGYAFHSRLYYPNSNKLTDPSIGFPVSHGCVRMYDEDINYIYDYIPLRTTVVVF